MRRLRSITGRRYGSKFRRSSATRARSGSVGSKSLAVSPSSMPAAAVIGKIKGTSGSRAYRRRVKIDRAFCDAIERAEVAAALQCANNATARFPQLHPQAQEIAGGIAAFAGVNSPFSEAVGLGLGESAGPREAEVVTA